MLKLSMRCLAIFILILSGIVPAEAVSGSPEGFETDVQTPNKPWTNLEFKNDPGAFQFAVVGDNAGGPRWGVFAEAVEKLNLLQPEFVIGVGDYIEGY